MNARLNLILVHGAWADGSSWSAVIQRLQADGYNVTAPQFPLSSLAADVHGSARSWPARAARPSSPATPTAAKS
jgi:peptidoglycan/LPS O-acetylase OafA/YrhL